MAFTMTHLSLFFKNTLTIKHNAVYNSKSYYFVSIIISGGFPESRRFT